MGGFVVIGSKADSGFTDFTRDQYLLKVKLGSLVLNKKLTWKLKIKYLIFSLNPKLYLRLRQYKKLIFVKLKKQIYFNREIMKNIYRWKSAHYFLECFEYSKNIYNVVFMKFVLNIGFKNYEQDGKI